MKLLEFKQHLESQDKIQFKLENGGVVPGHFHVTEVGKIHRHFIDCGGKEREETLINFQLWEAQDYDHRLHPNKLIEIINLSIDRLQLPDALIEVEYQGETIGKYGIDIQEGTFILINKTTACLAPDACVVPINKPKVRISKNGVTTCAPGSGCC